MLKEGGMKNCFHRHLQSLDSQETDTLTLQMSIMNGRYIEMKSIVSF